MPQRTFHFIEGNSSKFWSIEVSGTKTLVHYGKIGTSGQAQEKEFASEAAATIAADKLISEKTRKGYVEQAGTAPAAQPVTAAKRKRISQPAAAAAPAKAGEFAEKPASPSGRKPILEMQRRINLPATEKHGVGWLPYTPQPFPQAKPFVLKDSLEKIQRALTGHYTDSRKLRELVPIAALPEEAAFWLIVFQRRESYSGKLVAKIGSDYKKLPSDRRLSFAEIKSLVLNCWACPAQICAMLRALLTPQEFIEISISVSAGKREIFYENLAWLTDGAAAGFRKHIAPYLPLEERVSLRDWLSNRLASVRSKKSMQGVLLSFLASLGGGPAYEAAISALPDGTWNENWQILHCLTGLGDAASFVREARRLGATVKTPEEARLWLVASGWNELSEIADAVIRQRAKPDAEGLARVLALVEAPEAAEPMLRLQLESKASSIALEWFSANPLHAAAGLASAAQKQGKSGEAARAVLANLHRTGQREVLEAAAGLVDSVAAAFLRNEILNSHEETLETLSEADMPGEIKSALSSINAAKLPPWLSPAMLGPMRIGKARLPDEPIAQIITALTKQGDLSALIVALKANVSRDSLDAFLWALFSQWLSAGAPSKDKWALLALGHLGSDAIALKLAPLIRKWPGESQHQRAVTGLQVLRAIGTDTALMQLNGIAQKVPFKGLKDRARELMEEIAKDRGLTKAQLEDRIVPDCGLDARGTRTFDFGPRQFEFLLGSDLKPAIREASGKKRPDLPAPNSQDDPALSSQAVDDWKLLKKTLREILKIQTTRMEQAMVTGRRWTAEEFEMLLLRHPLMTHLARWVVWACYDSDGRPVHTFRVTEDQTLADASDDTFVLPQPAGIGIVHPFHLTDAEKNAWGQVFGDYEIIQPFPQLSRPVLTLTKAETSSDTITRAAGRKIPAGSLFGVFEKGGWQRDIPADAGGYSAHSKQFPAAGLTAFAHYDPGLWIGGSMAEMDDQDLTEVYCVPGLVVPDWWSHHKDRIPLSKVDPIALSEVLADVETLIGKAK